MQRVCKNDWCKQSFEVTDDDIEFYDKVSPIFNGQKYHIPPPLLCPDCRSQRRLSWRNERTLYQRACSMCRKSIISVHSPENLYPVYCNTCWYGDKWDAIEYGVECDSERFFLEQFRALYDRVPQRAMINDDGVMSENCAYCQDVAYAKNCYLCFGMWKMQDCYYCRICDQSKFCVDCEGVKLGSELVYESVDSQRLYHCSYLQNCENCTDCEFGFDLKGCSNCLACAGLRQKQYHVFNRPCTKGEYETAHAAYGLGTHTGREKLRKEFETFILKIPRKNMNLQNCEDCFGDHLFHCKDVLGYVCTNSQHSRWIERSDGPMWCYDIVQAGAPHCCFDCVTVDDGNMNCFCIYTNQTHNAMYCDNCLSSDFLLGCISLRRKKHCILNKQYTKEGFEDLAGRILESMIGRGEFGGFFPAELSPFGYNETNANEFFPLTRDEALRRGWKWRNALPYTTGRETVKHQELPEEIEDVVGDTVLNEIFACGKCGRNYKIIQQELEFYRRLSIPLPRICPDCRNLARLARRNPMRLWRRSCAKCRKEIQTTYSPDRPEIVYCEPCYLAEVY